MFKLITELNSLRKEKFLPNSPRDFLSFLICIFIFINASDMLESWLGFGSGSNFSDIQNVLLSTFWAGGVSVFVIQILVWVELVIRRIFGR